jgi:uncharacterized protein
MRFEFDWDPVKAVSNVAKHGVSFEEAMPVFLDPLALSRPDEDSSMEEERWVTMGQGQDTKLLVVVHTHAEIAEDTVAVRIISVRRPTRREIRQYEEGPV